jgi:hypothetical protein
MPEMFWSKLTRASEAARRLDISTKDLLGLVQERKIRYVMVDGIAHVPVGVLDEFRAKASRSTGSAPERPSAGGDTVSGWRGSSLIHPP